MGLEVSPTRPIARLVVGALSGHHPLRTPRLGPYVPPLVDAEPGRWPDPVDLLLADTIRHCEVLAHAILTGEWVDELERWLAEDVVVWSPTSFTISRADLLRDLRFADSVGDTLSEVVIEVTSVGAVLPRLYLEWRLTGRFTHPCFVDDDLLIEPTGRLVETAGVLVTTVVDGIIVAAHCYYDDVALLEQLVVSG